MTVYKLAIIGFGNVGQGLASILAQQQAYLKSDCGVDIRIVAICDPLKGSLANPDGLDPQQLLDGIAQHGELSQVPAPSKGWDASETIANSDADILVELAYTDLKTGEPALSHITQAIKHGLHVSMTNKGPVALHYNTLKQLAESHQVQIGIEGTVMSGTPALALGKDLLQAAGISKIQGILNGTTNYLLGEMAQGTDYKHALTQAQALGYAEADPVGDVEGYDAAAKVVILGNLLMGLSLTLDDVERQGISHLNSADFAKAKAANSHWKLLATVELNEGVYTASVKPTLIPHDHPLASVSAATNAITYTTTLLGDITLVGPGAGRLETGYAVIEDILAIHRRNLP